MEIVKKREGEKLTVAVSGRLDNLTAPKLGEALEPEFAGLKEIVLDFENLDYLSSSGLRIIAMAHKIMKQQGGETKIINVNDLLMAIFYDVGFTGFIDIRKK